MEKKLSKKQYYHQYKDKKGSTSKVSKREKALERAWKNRDFEIELYWKRATYFWAFTAATFTGYFLVLKEVKPDYLELVLASMGFIFSLSWYQVNRGSKGWQENWEKHIDMLEDDITGPLYKTILPKNFPSVSKVNMKVSAFVTLIWVVLIIKYFIPKLSINCTQWSWAEGIIMLLLLFFTYKIFDFKNWLKWKLKDSDDFTFEVRDDNYKNPVQ